MNSTAEALSDAKDRVIDDAAAATRHGAAEIKRVVKDIEELLVRTAKLDDPRVAAVRARLEDSLEAARSSTMRTAGKLRSDAVAAAKTTDEFVHDRPWAVAGVAVVAGLALGAALFRR